LDAALAEIRGERKIALVPTMGALHEGHLSLIDLAKSKGFFTIASIFVNPLQFNDPIDYERYPRSFGVDNRLLSDRGCDLLFAPEREEIFPQKPELISAKSITGAEVIANTLEGEFRPGHFDGMLTVVSRLFDVVNPDAAIFGQKDAQQLALIRLMVRQQVSKGDRSPIEIIAADTVRAESGLALSSRNSLLSAEDKTRAASISQALNAADGAPTAADAILRAIEVLNPEISIDYLVAVHPDSFVQLKPDETGAARMVFAGRLDGVRLIDNMQISIGSGN
jgi:pantoate--beta-alanine ligase